MTTLIDILQSAGIFLAGLFVRLLFFLVVLAAVLVPILIVFEAIQGLKALKRRRGLLYRCFTVVQRAPVVARYEEQAERLRMNRFEYISYV